LPTFLAVPSPSSELSVDSRLQLLSVGDSKFLAVPSPSSELFSRLVFNFSRSGTPSDSPAAPGNVSSDAAISPTRRDPVPPFRRRDPCVR
jgi:hypothetical protein